MINLTKRAGWILPGLAGLGVMALAAVLFFFDPNQYAFYPTCLFHKATGLLCPGCGSLRALHQLLHGHLGAAFRFNPLLILSLPVCGWFLSVWAFKKWKGRPVSVALPIQWLWLLAAAILVFTVWRNVPGSPLALRPG